MHPLRHLIQLAENTGPTASHLLDNPAFKKWFGKSKVVDQNGNPLPVYHGTSHDIEEFRYEFTGRGFDALGSGFYFTTDPDDAHGYAARDSDDGARIMPVFLSIKKPLDAEKEGTITAAQAHRMIMLRPNDDGLSNWGDISDPRMIPRVIAEAAESYAFEDYNIVRGLFALANDMFGNDNEAFNKALYQVFGWDGIVLNHRERGTQHWVAFFPWQIKSVFNKGSFSKKSGHVSESAVLEESLNLDRLRTMLDMAGRETTPDGEAINALRAARRMLQAANLSFSEINFEDQSKLVARYQKEIDVLRRQVAELRNQLNSRSRTNANSGASVGKKWDDFIPTFK